MSADPKGSEYRRLLKDAYLQLRKLRAEANQPQSQQPDPIAVTGIGCRLPGGAVDLASFWSVLDSGEGGSDAISAVPADRWDPDAWSDPEMDPSTVSLIRRGGFLEDIKGWDNGFFLVSPKEAVSMDPQHRLLMETAWEALENAAIDAETLKESNGGVYIGLSNSDHAKLVEKLSLLTPYTSTGSSSSVASGRLAYFLGWHGPAITIDTACASSLVAVHLACQDLRTGQCEIALAGGVNLIVSPQSTIALSKLGMLSPDGRCKTFDADADGFVRGEGCGVLVLKPLSRAQADGDRVLAVIRGSAVNQDGRSGGLTAPHGPAQEEVLRRALADAGVAPEDIDYVEAHGTGTSLGDPIELQALDTVLGAGREPDRPLMVGSVKTNIGHLEAAAGVAGLIKVILALQHQSIPPHLHFHRPNPHLDWDKLRLSIPTRARRWPARRDRPRRAGVSSFGFSGTNAHVIVEEAPAESAAAETTAEVKPDSVRVEPRESSEELLVVSAMDEAALGELAGRYARDLEHRAPGSWADICHTAAVGRTHFEHRLAVVAASPQEAAEQLKRFVNGAAEEQPSFEGYRGRSAAEPWPGAKPVFVFGEQAAQWGGALGELRERQPRFRQSLERCDRLIGEVEGNQLSRLIESGEDPPARWRPLELISWQWALVEMWRSWGIEPAAVVGEGMGEWTAACVAGVMNVEQALELATAAGDRETLEKVAAATEYKTAEVRWVSGETGDEITEAPDAGYWVERTSPGQDGIDKALATLEGRGCRTFLELAPANTLRETARKALGEAFKEEDWLPSLPGTEENDAQRTLLRTVGALYVRGAAIQWDKVDPRDSLRRVALPTYPFQRRPFWIEASAKRPSVAVDEPDRAGEGEALETLSRSLVETTWKSVEWPEARENASSITDHWLVMADEQGAGKAIALELAARSRTRVVVALREKGELKFLNDSWRLSGETPEEFHELFERAFGQAQCRGVVNCWGLDALLGEGDEEWEKPGRLICEGALTLSQALASRSGAPAVWLITKGAHSLTPDEPCSPLQTALWGLGRTIALEHPELRCRLVDLDPATESFDQQAVHLTGLLAGERLHEDQLCIRGGELHAPRLVPWSLSTATRPMELRSEASYLITGGLGGLGLQVAEWMAGAGAKHIVFAGRNPPDEVAQGALQRIAAKSVDCVVSQTDVSRREEVDKLMARFDEDWPPLAGVIHAAGLLKDGLLANESWESMREVMASKIGGGWNLHCAAPKHALDFFVLFSSGATMLGSEGQASHTAANAFLDGLSFHRRSRGLPAISICWGAWKEVGAVARREETARRMAARGMGSIHPSQGKAVLEAILSDAICPARIGVLPIDWPRFLERTNRGSSPYFEAFRLAESRSTSWSLETSAAPSRRTPVSLTQGPGRNLPFVRQTVAEILEAEVEDVDPARGFTELGIDSLMAVSLRNRLQEELELSDPLPATVVYEYPSVEKLSRYLDARVAGPHVREATEDSSAVRDEPIAIVGMACRFPGGANDLDRYWALLRDGVDAICEVPKSRWSTPEGNSEWGGFLDVPIDLFDADFFDIAAREACEMDPQHRLLLEVAWAAMEHAGHAHRGELNSSLGVFVGMMNNDYLRLQSRVHLPSSPNAYAATGVTPAMAAGRIAYFLGANGPALTVDTACSSSLAAVHLACRSLRTGECRSALAGGVSLMLAPDVMSSYASAGMLAADGRCKTFDAAADGFVRGEGCGIVVLKSLSEAIADGNRIWGLLTGTAMNQDGHSGGLTVPSGKAQERVMHAALRSAGVSPGQIEYIEAHGTGTALGDPIELRALHNVYRRTGQDAPPLKVGSVKTNVGHLESAAGVASLIKSILAMHHGQIPASLHFSNPNPHLPWEQMSLRIVSATEEWEQTSAPKRAAVSSFGASGTNVHVVIEEAPPSSRPAGDRQPDFLLCLSAAAGDALRELAGKYRLHLAEKKEERLTDICYTAAVGRTHLQHRLAVIGGSREQLSDRLKAFAEDDSHEALRTGRILAGNCPGYGFLFGDRADSLSEIARHLLQTSSAFTAIFKACQRLSQSQEEASLVDPANEDSTDGLTIFCLQYSLAMVWQSWAGPPACVAGIGCGTLAASCIAGSLSLEEAIRAAAEEAPFDGSSAAQSARPAIPLIIANADSDAIVRLPEVVPTEIGRGAPENQDISCDLLLELGQAGESVSLPASLSQPAISLSSNADHPWIALLEAAAESYVRGIDFDWSRFYEDESCRLTPLPGYPFQRRRFWFQEGGADKKSRQSEPHIERPEKPSPTGEWFDLLLQTPVDYRLPVLVKLVGGEVADVLEKEAEIVDPTRGLAELGVDSLMAVEIGERMERRFGRSLPDTLAFDEPSIERIAGFLLGELRGELEPSEVAATIEEESYFRQLEHLSEGELEKKLSEKLDQLDLP